MTNANKYESSMITESMAQRLIATQFPQWQHLTVKAVKQSGWDNRTFHLGHDMVIRMPSAAEYAGQVEKEHTWLPVLASKLPLPITVPLVLGNPAEDYPWHWSINRWLKGESAATAPVTDLPAFASDLAKFLAALERIDATGGPLAGAHSFHRGGHLDVYDSETREAIEALKGTVDVHTARQIWETALSTVWQGSPVWIHGDVSVGNLLVNKGKLSAVIDFGQLAVGDPACDLAIAWTFFKGKSRDVFRETIQLDADTWERGRAWTLWKALISLAALVNSRPVEARQWKNIIDEVITDHKQTV